MLSGLLLGCAFTPIDWWPLAFLGVAGFTLSVRGLTIRRAMAAGYLFALVLFTVTVSYTYVLGWWVAVLMVGAISLYGLLLGAAQRAVQKLPFWPVWVASIWTLTEACWSRFPVGGFGWTRLAFSTADQPLGSFLRFFGAAGVGWLVALIGATLAWLAVQIVDRTDVRKAAVWATSVGVVTVLLVGQALSYQRSDAGGELVHIGVVQGNVDGTAGPRAMGYARSVINNHLSETINLVSAAESGRITRPDFIVWPENATDFDPTQDQATEQAVKAALDIAEVPIFVGAIMRGPGEDERQTSGLWFSVDGDIEARYDKRNAVPFGEYTPLRKIVLPLVPLARNVGRQTVPGTEPGILSVSYAGQPLRLGDIICYELAFDKTIYQTAGWRQPLAPEVVVVQSNNASYMGTVQPAQQMTITRVRAMEMRREIVVATTNGVSGLIDAQGKLLSVSDSMTAASTTFTVPRRNHVTLGVQLGPWLELFFSLAALGAWAVAWRQERKTRRREQADEDVEQLGSNAVIAAER